MERVAEAQMEETANKASLPAAVDAAAPAVSAWDRLASWFALLDRHHAYYLIIGITALLLGLGLVMVLSTSSVQDLSLGLPAYSDFKKQLLGAALGLPLMYVAARSSPRLFRAAAYPLLGASIVGLGLTLIPGVGLTQNSASRAIQLGPFPAQPSELAKIALVLWGADLLARKERLRQLEDWRHLLMPLLPGAGLLCMLVMAGDDLGPTSCCWSSSLRCCGSSVPRGASSPA